MLRAIWNHKRRSEAGFTLIELVVVLAILGILIALAVPRYLGARRNALVSEGDNTLQELKTMGWAYFQQYNTFTGIAAGNFATAFGFAAPAGACWTWSASGDADVGDTATLTLTATGPAAGSPARCSALNAGSTITLTLEGDGSSARTQVLP